MPWIYSTIARTALRSHTHSPHPSHLTRRLSLQCTVFFAARECRIGHLHSSHDQIHTPKSRRKDAHNWPYAESARFSGAKTLIRIASSLVSGVSLRKQFLRSRVSGSRLIATSAAERLQDSDNNISNFEQPALLLDVSTTLSSARTSLSARQAVSLALQNRNGGRHDALNVLDSLRPILEQDPDAANFLNVASYPAITFNRPISPRLGAHALVHALIRQKRLKHATNLAIAMMQVGIRVHTRTLDIVMNSLKPAQPSENSVFKAVLPRNFLPNPGNLNDLVGMAEHASTRLALETFIVARRTGQKNMRGLLSTLLAICIVNTEIVLACFVFAMIVKEFYHPPPSRAGDTTEQTWNTEKYGPRSLVFLPQWTHLIDLTTPLRSFFKYVTTLHTGSPQFDQDALDANLQALAILANLLDNRQLHLTTISTLLTLMYNTPRVTSEVWVMDRAGNVRHEIAFQYFHEVLTRLIESPPLAGGSRRKKPSARAFTPPFVLETCNTLLYYALRHCHSRTLANKILVHLIEARKLAPDDVTYNVLLRAGTLLRDDELALLALSAVTQSREKEEQHISEPEYNLDVVSPLVILTHSKSEMARRIASVIKRIDAIRLSRKCPKELKEALYTLATLIMYLSATGHPHYVKTIVFALFPILHRQAFDQHITRRREAIMKAAQFGSPPFSVMLNALVKARAFPEARLLYNFAVAAERRSWFTCEPWTLGIDVYTVMLELCAAECREATRLEGIPAAVNNRRPVEVRVKAVRMALRLYKRLNKMPYYAYNTMRRYGHLKHVNRLVFPKPDERFAGAIIKVLFLLSKHLDPTTVAIPDIFVKHRNPRPRVQSKVSASAVSETYAKTKRDLARRGKLPEGWTQQLQFVVQGIVYAGMPVPPALRHLFLGRHKKLASPSSGKPRVSLRVVPWAYPAETNKDAWHPWTVQSVRTRGLLVRKMTRSQRARFQRKRRGV